MKAVLRSFPLLAPVAAFGASVALGEPSGVALSYTASGACLESPEGFNSKLEPNNSGVAWTTTFTSSGSVDARGNGIEVGQAIDTASFGVGPRMHMAAAYSYRINFLSKFFSADSGDRLHIASASGKFVTGPNAGVAFKLSDIELGKQGAGSVAFYGSAISPSIQTVSLENGTKFQRICTIILQIAPS